MTNATHTPGPWFVGNGDIYAKGTAASDYDDRVICAIGVGGMRSHEYAPIKAHKPEGRANARLIAAAPDLLAALQYVLDAADYDGALTMGTAALSPAIRDRIVRTIAQAKGETDHDL